MRNSSELSELVGTGRWLTPLGESSMLIIHLGIETADSQRTGPITGIPAGRLFRSVGLDGMASVSELALSFFRSHFTASQTSVSLEVFLCHLNVTGLAISIPFVTSTCHNGDCHSIRSSLITAK